jgi:hypothetical protein
LERLLDTALAMLPPETQALLTARYLEGLPAAELAKVLGMTENAAAVRLHRGKLLLRKLIAAEQNPLDAGWQATRIWCTRCGAVYYEGKFNSATGEFHIRCPRCDQGLNIGSWSHTERPETPVIQGMKSLKPALNRLMRQHDDHFRPALPNREIACVSCGRVIPLHLEMPAHLPVYSHDHPGVHYLCPFCGNLNYTALSGIGLSTPQGQQFWLAHPRIRQLDNMRVERDGRDVLIVRWESVESPKRLLAVIFAQDTYEVLEVEDGR